MKIWKNTIICAFIEEKSKKSVFYFYFLIFCSELQHYNYLKFKLIFTIVEEFMLIISLNN